MWDKKEGRGAASHRDRMDRLFIEFSKDVMHENNIHAGKLPTPICTAEQVKKMTAEISKVREDIKNRKKQEAKSGSHGHAHHGHKAQS